MSWRTATGRIDGAGVRHVHRRDHLGTVRAVQRGTDGAVVEATDHYPFGAEMPGRTYITGAETGEGYTGHELDRETGLVYAGARYYMPALGRWTSVDPLADAYPSHSPYNYALNNPVEYTDPTGRCPEDGSAGPNQYGPGECLAEVVVTADREPSRVRRFAANATKAAGVALLTPIPVVDEAVAGAVVVGAGVAVLILDPPKLPDVNLGQSLRDVRDFVGSLGQSSPLLPPGVVQPPQGMRPPTLPLDPLLLASANQMNQEIRRGQAPSGIERVDKGLVTGEQDHVHLGGGDALNRDGTWKHGGRRISNRERSWLEGHGWTVPGR